MATQGQGSLVKFASGRGQLAALLALGMAAATLSGCSKKSAPVEDEPAPQPPAGEAEAVAAKEAPAEQAADKVAAAEQKKVEPAEQIDVSKLGPPSDLGGLFRGSFGDEFPGEWAGIILEDGLAGFRTKEGNAMFGRFKSTEAGGFEAQLQSFLEGAEGPALTLSGRATARKSISGMFKVQGTDGEGAAQPFSLSYDKTYEDVVTLKTLAGDYVARNNVLTISETGAVSGKSADGCTAVGQVVAKDPRFIGFEISYQLTECFRPGQFDGVLALASEKDKHDALHFVVTGQHLAATGHMHRKGSASEVTKH